MNADPSPNGQTGSPARPRFIPANERVARRRELSAVLRLPADARLFAWLLVPEKARAHQQLAPATVQAQRHQISL